MTIAHLPLPGRCRRRWCKRDTRGRGHLYTQAGMFHIQRSDRAAPTLRRVRPRCAGAPAAVEHRMQFQRRAADLLWLAMGRCVLRSQVRLRSEEHTSELQSLMRRSYAVFYLKKNTHKTPTHT